MANLQIISDNLEGVRKEIDKSDKVLNGLLDFYSDRATSHASLSIAVIFGIFGLLTIYQENIIILFIFYALFWSIALYLLLNFGWYAQIADRVKLFLTKNIIAMIYLAAYRACDKVGNIDDFIIMWVKVDWLYSTPRGIIYSLNKNNKMNDESKKSKILWDCIKNSVFRYFNRNYIIFKELIFKGELMQYYFQREEFFKKRYLLPEIWRELLKLEKKPFLESAAIIELSFFVCL